MTPDVHWDGGWRHGQYQADHNGRRQSPPTPGASASSESTMQYAQPWTEKFRAGEQHHQSQRLPSVTGPYTDPSNGLSGSQQRHSPSSGNVTTTSPPSHRFASPWHGLPLDHPAQQKHAPSAPLTLQIPENQDLPRISNESHSYRSTPVLRQQTTTSLPSFASFHEHATRAEEPDEVEIAPMSARLPCDLCAKLTPMVREVAVAVAELDECVHTYCNKSATRRLEMPKDSPMRAVQWILDTIAKAKGDLQRSFHREHRSYLHAQPTSAYQALAPYELSTPNLLKRPAWDEDDLLQSKKQRFNATSEESTFTAPGSLPKEERRSSVDLVTRSPPPTESAPGSAHAKSSPPGISAAPPRALLSPSSLAYPLSAAPSVIPHAANSVGSPAMSYEPAASIHTTSTSSVTSAHIADLQHQITLKSLSLQTLQSEYSSLLQKLQRERVKSQTIEKKTSVADQEVNDLTTRNEELAEQVKNLEAQLESSEKKREDDRAGAAREKEQWGRMLELGGRIQSKHADEKQKLKDENDVLSQRLAAYQSHGSNGLDRPGQTNEPRLGNSPGAPEHSKHTPFPPSLSNQNTRATEIEKVPSNDNASSRREIEVLQSRIEVLRFSLEEARRHNQLLDARAHEVIERSGRIRDVVQRALDDEDAIGGRRTAPPSTIVPEAAVRSNQEREEPIQAREKSLQDPKYGAVSAGGPMFQYRGSSDGPESRNTSQCTSSSSTTMASVARAVSPGPAELGFHVTPSTSSPEELIQALGPVPAPIPSVQLGAPFPSSSFGMEKQWNSSKRGKPSHRQNAEAVTPWVIPRAEERHDRDTATQIGSFRPLSHHDVAPESATFRPSERRDMSPYSHHSSPGPMRDDTSPSSAGSAEGLPVDQRNDGRVYPHVHAVHPHSKGFDSMRVPDHTAVMPPPPRPNLLTGPYTSPQPRNT